jgi:hypothetical protein
VQTIGEAMDSGDKATNKAMATGFKYAAFQSFCIPLEAMAEDADATTPDEVRPSVPAGYGDWRHNLEAAADEGTPALRGAWRGSKSDFRDFMTTHYPAILAELKARAAKADGVTA